MDLREEYWEAREWVANNFTVKIGKCVSLFEATIRVLGGFFFFFFLVEVFIIKVFCQHLILLVIECIYKRLVEANCLCFSFI
jgi:hypothetical protein